MNAGFAHPWALWALLAIPALWALTLIASRRRRGVAIPSQTRIAAAGSGIRAQLRWVPLACMSLALACVIVALARPREVISDSRSSRDTIALQLVVDRSGSMEEAARLRGRAVRRLDAVKEVVEQFVLGNGAELRGREGDLIGLIVFGTFADTITPLTRSHETLVAMLREVELPRIERERSTAIGDALVLAAARLRATEDAMRANLGDESFQLASKAIVLLTDGENREGDYTPAQAAELAAQWDIKVYIIGIGASGNAPGGFFNLAQRRGINDDRMRRIAERTGGRFWSVDDLDQLADVYAAIDELERTDVRVTESTRYDERFAPYLRTGVVLALLALGARSLVWMEVS